MTKEQIENVSASEKKQVEPEILSYKNVKLDYAKKPINVGKIIKIFCCLIVFILVAFATYLYQKNNKIVLKKGLTTLISQVEDEIYTVRNHELFTFQKNKPFRDSLMLNFDTSYDEHLIAKEEQEFLDMLTDVSASMTFGLDYKNKQFSYDVKSTYLGENIFEIYGNGNDSSITYKIKDVLGKFIRVPVSNLERIYVDTKTDKKDVDKIKEEIIKTLFLNIKEDGLKREKTKITLNGKEYKVQDVSLSMNNKYLQTLFKKTIEDLKQSESFIQNVMHYTDLTETRLKELLEEEIQIIEDTTFTDDTITLHIYMQGFMHKIVGCSVAGSLEETYSIRYYFLNGESKIQMIRGEKEVFYYDKKEVSKEKTNYTVRMKEILSTIIRYQKDNRVTYDYKIEGNKDYYFMGSLTLANLENKANKDGTIRLSIQKFNHSNSKISDIYATINYNIKQIESLNLHDDSEAILNSALTEDDKKEMKRRVETTEHFASLKAKLNALKKG